MASLPGKLPIGVPCNLWLPYHGKVYQGAITLPNDRLMVYPQPVSGSVFKVSHPRAITPTVTADQAALDIAMGRQRLDYAYLSGETMHIGGQQLGQNRWLYCDASRTWVMRIAKNVETRRIEVYVENLFGVFSDRNYSMSERKVLSYAPVSDWLFNVPTNFVLRYFPSEDGSLVTVNLMYAYVYSSGLVWTLPISASRFGSSTLYNDLEEAFTITVDGNGSTTPGSLGTGITASTTLHVAGYENTYEYTETGAADTAYPCRGYRISDNGTYYKTWLWGWSYQGTLLYYRSASGELKTLKYSWSTLTDAVATANVALTVSEDEPPVTSGSVTTTLDYTTTETYSLLIGDGSYSYPAVVLTYSGSTTFLVGDEDCTTSSTETTDSWYDGVNPYFRYARLIEGQYIQVKTDSGGNENVRIYSLDNGDSTDHVGVFDHCAYDLVDETFYFGTPTAVVGVV